jgi:hypothetical protein
VEAGRVEGDEFIGERIGMAVPYILVNNPMSYAGGREIYGYPKTLGIFDPASGVGDPLKVEAFGGEFSPTNEARWQPLFELRRTVTPPAGGGAAGGHWRSLADASEELPRSWEGLAEGLPEVSLLESILKVLTGQETLQVFLKQFRDVKEPGKACYRQVIEAPIEFLKTQVRPSLEEWQLVVDHLDSHPIDKELGLKTQTTIFSFDGQMDFVAAPGQIVAP